MIVGFNLQPQFWLKVVLVDLMIRVLQLVTELPEELEVLLPTVWVLQNMQVVMVVQVLE
jgi:hypothetical protein